MSRRQHRRSYLDPAIAYRERNRILAAMGYASYRDYLASPLWRSIRAGVLAGGPACSVCRSRPASQAHHAAYNKAILEGRKQLHKIIPVCAGCHSECEFRAADGKKLSVRQATAKMRQRRTNLGKTGRASE